jgi:hypothetical protein
MKPLPLLSALLALASAPVSARAERSTASAGEPTAEQVAIMDRIEREVQLPQGAGPLGTYRRQYAWHEEANGKRMTVVAIYVRPGGTPGREWLENEADLPMIDDGGCGIVTLIYIVGTQRIQTVACNGVG